MLAKVSAGSEVDLSRCAPLEVQLPQHLAPFFDETGYSASCALDQRGNARLRIRAEGRVQFVYAPPSIPRTVKLASVLVRDLSRSGVCILYHEQVYPEEQFKLYFQGRAMHYVVVRCRREGGKCYEVGARLLGMSRTLDDPE